MSGVQFPLSPPFLRNLGITVLPYVEAIEIWVRLPKIPPFFTGYFCHLIELISMAKRRLKKPIIPKEPKEPKITLDEVKELTDPAYIESSERHRRKALLVKMLGGKCSRCGYCNSIRALSFHHSDPSTKLFDISNNGNLMKDWKVVEAEAKKCVLLCLNCHATAHIK